MSGSINRFYARSVLIQLAVVAIALAVIIIWQWDLLASLYSRNQISGLGWLINGVIFVLFAFGMLVILRLLLRYATEEVALARFAQNLSTVRERETGAVGTIASAADVVNVLDGVSPASLVSRRFSTLLGMFERRAPINHGALASTTVAGESGHLGVPKFVNNVLILTGVLGTIVSLSVALLGASDLITTGAESGGLSTVISGMSTALSTTMTAIVAYLVFGYFYLRVLDTQTHVISRLEDVSATDLVPRFQTSPDTLVNDYSRLLSTGTELLQRMDTTHQRFSNTAAEVELLLTELRSRIANTHDSIEDVRVVLREQLEHGRLSADQMRLLLREGFRLPRESGD